MSTKIADIITKQQNLSVSPTSQLEKYSYLNISMDSLNNSSGTSSTSSLPNVNANPTTTTTSSNLTSDVEAGGVEQSVSRLADLAATSLKLERAEQASEIEPDHLNEAYDSFDTDKVIESGQSIKSGLVSTTTIKRTHLINLIFELYNLSESISLQDASETNNEERTVTILIESYMEKLPPGKTLKNSILLAWKRRYFKLNSLGNLMVFDIDEKTGLPKDGEPVEVYNLMGGRVEYDQTRVISLDDSRGRCLVFRCCANVSLSEQDETANKDLYVRWQSAIDSQIVDRSEMLWVRPGQPITTENLKPTLLNRVFTIIFYL
jgi:hypothetical protein